MVYEVHDYSDIIKFKNSIMVDKSRNNGEQPLRYKLENERHSYFWYYE